MRRRWMLLFDGFLFLFYFFSSFDWESKISPFSFLYYYNSRWNLYISSGSAPQRWEWRMNNNNNNKDRIYFLFFPFFDVYSREGKKTFLQTTQEPVVHTIVSSTHTHIHIRKKPFLFFFFHFGGHFRTVRSRARGGARPFFASSFPPVRSPPVWCPSTTHFYSSSSSFYSLVIFFSFLFSPVRKANTHNAQQPKTTYSATTTTTTTIISNI
jgi:hypothetical protein